MQSNEDKEFVIRLKNEDYSAFDALFKKYSEPVYAFSLSITKESYSAEDITQLVFIKIWQKRELLDEFLSFKSFLFRITYNEVVSWIRKANSEKRRISHYAGSHSFESDETATLVEFNNINSIAEQIIEQLPEKRKEIFKLSREQGLTNREIAEKLDISVKTVENQMSAALKLLKEKLGSSEILGLLFFYIMFHK